jgi:hypothetical protein
MQRDTVMTFDATRLPIRIYINSHKCEYRTGHPAVCVENTTTTKKILKRAASQIKLKAHAAT